MMRLKTKKEILATDFSDMTLSEFKRLLKMPEFEKAINEIILNSKKLTRSKKAEIDFTELFDVPVDGES